ncbi:hypothetical protein [Streptomyces deserti]
MGTRRFELTWGATRATPSGPLGFVTRTGSGPDALRFGLWSEFVTGQVALSETTAPAPAE